DRIEEPAAGKEDRDAVLANGGDHEVRELLTFVNLEPATAVAVTGLDQGLLRLERHHAHAHLGWRRGRNGLLRLALRLGLRGNRLGARDRERRRQARERARLLLRLGRRGRRQGALGQRRAALRQQA